MSNVTKKALKEDLQEVIEEFGHDYPSRLDTRLVLLAHKDPEGYKELMEEYPEMLEKNDYFDTFEIGVKTFVAPYTGHPEVFNYVKDLFDAHGKSAFNEEQLNELNKNAVWMYEQQDEAENERAFFKETTGHDISDVKELFIW